jgi:hypothetical protein
VIAAANIAVQAAGYGIERIPAELKDSCLSACRRISLQLGYTRSTDDTDCPAPPR